MFRPKSLRQRLVFYLFVPVAVLLLSIGLAGFFYARALLLAEWREATILKLQRAAHQVDMRLGRYKGWLQIYRDAVEQGYPVLVQRWIAEKLRATEGVAGVRLSEVRGDHQRPATGGDSVERDSGRHDGYGGGRRGDGVHQRRQVIEVGSPRFDSVLAHETVSLTADLADSNGGSVGRLEVAVHFDSLMENVVSSNWWQGYQAYLVDQNGTILTCTTRRELCRLGEANDPLQAATVNALQKESSGTILGPGHPPEEVSGFYRLEEAPWSLVVFAPGREILAPVIHLRNYYFAIGSGVIVLVLLLIRWVTGGTAAAIRDVAGAAQRVAHGDYAIVLESCRADEVGQLVSSFNQMVQQLEAGMRMRQALDLAMEVQQSLLPTVPPRVSGLDIAGRSLYCDETGGDYYDFLQFAEWGAGRVVIAVGDVAGHGIGAALLMTTARALLRARLIQPGSLSQVVADANRLLCMDTAHSGNFMTLFLLQLDASRRQASWIRAGHDPATVYDPCTDAFSDCVGEGMAMGVDQCQLFQENQLDGWNPGRVILIGTDGIWETENADGVMFGKDRLRALIRSHRDGSAADILQAIIDAIQNFRQTAPQLDDITLVVVKII